MSVATFLIVIATWFMLGFIFIAIWAFAIPLGRKHWTESKESKNEE